LTIF